MELILLRNVRDVSDVLYCIQVEEYKNIQWGSENQTCPVLEWSGFQMVGHHFEFCHMKTGHFSPVFKWSDPI